MAITVVEVIAQELDRCRARIRYRDNELVAFVRGSLDEVRSMVGKRCVVELDFARVTQWELIPGFRDDESEIVGIDAGSSSVRIRGRACGKIDVGDGTQLVDIYVQAGPDFVTVDRSQVDTARVSVGDGLEVQVEGLCFYPTGT